MERETALKIEEYIATAIVISWIVLIFLFIFYPDFFNRGSSCYECADYYEEYDCSPDPVWGGCF